jgi:hypothetical protein
MDISSIAPAYMYHLCQCASSILDLSRAHDLGGRDVLHENIQTSSKDSKVETQLVLRIFILFNLLAPEFHIQILAHPVCKM